MALERLQKIVARAGLASRRGAEELITSGRVRLNGRIVTELGTQADPRKDDIEVDGRKLIAERPVYILLHKPRGVVSTRHDPEGRPTVVDLVSAYKATLYPVGRLDFHTSGALLLTNDGEFTQGLLHPKKKVPKTYAVKVQGQMETGDIEHWCRGVRLDDGTTAPCEVKLLRHENKKTWIEVTLREGRNQQIRRMGEATGFPVMRLARLSFAGVTTEGLRPGECRPMTLDELRSIKAEYGVPRRIPKGEPELEERPRPPQRRGGFPRFTDRAGGPGEGKAPRGEGSSGRTERAPARGERAHARGERAPARGERESRERRASRGEREAPRGARPPAPGDSRGNRPRPPRNEPRAPRPLRDERPKEQRPTPSRSRQNSSAAVPSARAQADSGTRSRPPSRTRRPR
jgi:23S rRNA pseudouridine2605 synthase